MPFRAQVLGAIQVVTSALYFAAPKLT